MNTIGCYEANGIYEDMMCFDCMLEGKKTCYINIGDKDYSPIKEV